MTSRSRGILTCTIALASLLTLSACDSTTLIPPQSNPQITPRTLAATGSRDGAASRNATAQMGGPDVASVAEQVRPATVLVQNLALASRDSSQAIGAGLVPRGVGTGFIYDPDGYIVTNHHVAPGPHRSAPPQDAARPTAAGFGTDG